MFVSCLFAISSALLPFALFLFAFLRPFGLLSCCYCPVQAFTNPLFLRRASLPFPLLFFLLPSFSLLFKGLWPFVMLLLPSSGFYQPLFFVSCLFCHFLCSCSFKAFLAFVMLLLPSSGFYQPLLLCCSWPCSLLLLFSSVIVLHCTLGVSACLWPLGLFALCLPRCLFLSFATCAQVAIERVQQQPL